MSKHQVREPGWYWVKYRGEGEWEVEKWTGEFWKSKPLTYGEQDLIWCAIGPRVPTPEELASMEQKIAALSAQVDDLVQPILNEADAAMEAPKRPSGTINVRLEHAERPFLEGK